jgi:hypothetical protein
MIWTVELHFAAESQPLGSFVSAFVDSIEADQRVGLTEGNSDVGSNRVIVFVDVDAASDRDAERAGEEVLNTAIAAAQSRLPSGDYACYWGANVIPRAGPDPSSD